MTPALKQSRALALVICVGYIFACKPHQNDSELEAVLKGPITGREFDGLSIKAELGFLGRVNRTSASEDFQSNKDLDALIQQMWKAFAGSSSSLRFIHCESRAAFPNSIKPADCSNVLKDPSATFEFSFLPMRTDTAAQCTMLANEKCEIFQVVKLILPSNSFQRPPVFARKTPVRSGLMLVNTFGIFYPRGPNMARLFGPWISPDQTASILINPYNIPSTMGRQLAGLLGQCGKEYVNLINFSNAGLKTSADYRKPAQLSEIAVTSLFSSFAIIYVFETLAAFRQAAALRYVFRESHWNLAKPTLDLVTAVTGAPAAVTMMDFEEEMKKYPKNSPQQKVISTAALMTNVSLAGATAMLGTSAVKHLGATAKILGLVAGGAGALNTSKAQKMITDLRSGNLPNVLYTLCTLEKQRGKKVDCQPPEKTVELCNK